MYMYNNRFLWHSARIEVVYYFVKAKAIHLDVRGKNPCFLFQISKKLNKSPMIIVILRVGTERCIHALLRVLLQVR